MATRPARTEKHPHECIALGTTSKEEARERNEVFRKLGINARHEEFKDGFSRLNIYSEKAEREVAKVLNVFNKDYGSPRN